VRHRFGARCVRHECRVRKRPCDAAIKTLELLDDSMEFGQISAGGREGIGRVESGIENSACDGRIPGLEFSEEFLDLSRGHFGESDDHLPLDQAKTALKSVDFVLQHLADAPPR